MVSATIYKNEQFTVNKCCILKSSSFHQIVTNIDEVNKKIIKVMNYSYVAGLL